MVYCTVAAVEAGDRPNDRMRHTGSSRGHVGSISFQRSGEGHFWPAVHFDGQKRVILGEILGMKFMPYIQ